MISRITFVSANRADLSALTEILRLSGGKLLARVFLCSDGATLQAQLREDGIDCPIACAVALPEGDSGRDASLRIARLTEHLAGEFAQHPPDLVVVLGDRYELLAVLGAAIPSGVPLAHISGGEITEGAFDEQIRHAVTKAAHLHFVAHEEFAQRLRGMGEEAWRITVTGDPGLDRIQRSELAAPTEIAARLGFPVDGTTVLIAFHPVTHHPEQTWLEWQAMAEALSGWEGRVIVTGCNSDPQGGELRRRQEEWVAECPRRIFREHLGQRLFLGLLSAGAILVGNSSSAIWEAPSLRAPAVNIGLRQKGRLRGRNVWDVETATPSGIRQALLRASDRSWREALRETSNPYGDGKAAERILGLLESLPSREILMHKRFVDHVQ